MPDRIIDVPTANKLPFGTVREEVWGFPGDRRSLYTFTEAGIGPSFEAGFRTQRLGFARSVATFDVSYNYVVPLQSFAPGISVGLLDGANSTPDGRRVYLATTFDAGGGASTLDAGVRTTLGLQVGRRASAFVGVDIPIASRVSLLAEHDGFRVNAGIEVRPAPSVRLRWMQLDRKPALSLSLSQKF